MKTVWKFPFEIADRQLLKMPQGAEIIHVGFDPYGALCLWAKVEPTRAAVEHLVFVTGTGHELPDGDPIHLGSFNQGPFVWHAWIARAVGPNVPLCSPIAG